MREIRVPDLFTLDLLLRQLEVMRPLHSGVIYDSESDEAWERNPYCTCGKPIHDCELRALLAILDGVEVS